MHKILGSDDDDDDDDLKRPSPLLQTQRFTKSGTIGTRDLKTTQIKPKQKEVSSLNINLNRIHDDDDDNDSLNDSDDDTNSKTARSTSSATTSQLTPKPKERTFLRNNTEKPKVKPRIDIDDDEQNVFGQTTMKPSPRHQILSMREEKERDESFMKGFHAEKKRQSPENLFQTDYKSDSRRNSRKSPHEYEDKMHNDSDDDKYSTKQTKQPSFQKSRHSITDNEKSQSRKNSHRSKDDSDQSDYDEEERFNKQSRRSDHGIQRLSIHDLPQVIKLFFYFRLLYSSLMYIRHRRKILIHMVFNINYHQVDLVQQIRKKLNQLGVHLIVKIKIQLYLK